MTQEDRELLLKDIYARIPHGVKGCCESETFRTTPLHWYAENTLEYSVNYMVIKNGWRPYLFPLSSMTKEQESYLHFNTKFRLDICNDLTVKIDEDDNCFYTDTYDYISLIDWLNKHHFDYRGLILKGLALDATGKNIY